MYLRTLSIEEMGSLYTPCLKRDFPPDELMPWKLMEPLIRKGFQHSVGFFDSEGLAAYALFITDGADHFGAAGLQGSKAGHNINSFFSSPSKRIK